MADLVGGAFGPMPPSGPVQPPKPVAQRIEEAYFAGRKPSQDEILGLRQEIAKYQNSSLTESQLESLFQRAKEANIDFAGSLGDDYYQNKLAQQIANQRKNLGTEKYYAGDLGAIGGIDAATSYMASRLVRSGIRDLSEIGERPIQEDGAVTGKQIYNKRTGQPLKQGDDAQYYYAVNTIAPDANQYTFGGTFAGKNTSLNISMVDGLPVFYTTPGPSSSDFDVKDIAPFVAIASLAVPGIGQAIGTFVVEAALGTATAQGMSAAALGAIGSGVLTSVLTGDIKQGVMATAGSYLGAQVRDLIGGTAKEIFDSPMGKKFAESIGGAMTRAAILGQDVATAGLSAAAGESLNLVTNSIPGFSDIKDPRARESIINAVQAALDTPGNLSDKITNATLQGAVTYGASQFNVDGKKFFDLTPGQQALVTTTISSMLSGQPVDQELIKRAVTQAQSDFAATLKQPTAAQPEDFGAVSEPTPPAQPSDFGYQPNFDVQPMIGDVGFLPSPGLTSVRSPQQLQVDPLTGEVVFAPSVIRSFGVDRTTGLPTSSPMEGPPALPPRIPTLDPQQGIVSDVGPPIRREELLTDPTKPARELAPGSIPGEVPMRRDTVAGGSSLADLIQEESEKIVGGTTKPVSQLASSGQIVSDVSDSGIDRFARALQPGRTQVFLLPELEGLQAIVNRMRDAGISDDIIEETLVNAQATNPDFREMLRGNAVKPTDIGESTGPKTGDVTQTGTDQTAGLVSVGTSTTPPDTGGSTIFGQGSGAAGGFVPFSIAAFDTGTGTTTYDMNNGFSLFLFADGRQKVMDNDSGVIIDLVSLPKDIQDEIQLRIAAADAAQSAEALKVPAEDKKEPAKVAAPETTPEVKIPERVEVVDTKQPIKLPPSDVKPVDQAATVQEKAADTPAKSAAQEALEKALADALAALKKQLGRSDALPADLIQSATGANQAATGKPSGSTEVAGPPVTNPPVSSLVPATSLPSVAPSGGDLLSGDATVLKPVISTTQVTNKADDAAKPVDTTTPSGDVSDTKPVTDTSVKATDTTGTPVVTQPSGSQLTEQDITRIVNNALLANPGLSEADVKRIVGDAISKIPGGPTATDIQNAVNTAIGTLPKSPTAQDITDAVDKATKGFVTGTQLTDAISGIKFPAGLSQENVRGIVQTVMTENPGLGINDVKAAINIALSNLPAAASPTDVTNAISGAVGSPSVADNPNTPEDESKPATGVYSVIESYQGEAKKQAEEASRKVTLLNLGTSMLGGAAGAGILGGLGSLGSTSTPLSPLRALTTGEASDEFVSPLAAFQKQIGLLQPEQETKPEERTMPYFSYGQPSEVASVLGLDEEDQMAAQGGLMTPLMASGGLPVVHYAGKPRTDYRQGAYVQGPGDGQSDDIPAMLADGEYVFDAETVAALGNGSNKAGAKLLDKMREQIRAHKRGGSLKKIPPASKSPLEYLAMVKR